jgi:XTP/dITP diphosphohydrolase
LLTVLITSPRVAPGLLSWPAWQALRSAAEVIAPVGHPALPALREAGIAYRTADSPADGPDSPADGPGSPGDGPGSVVWLAPPGEGADGWPGAQVLPGSADLPGAHLLDLVVAMDRLRTDCPWDARQTHESLAPYLLEEPYEALEALELGDEQAFCEELGDVLLQVVFHARIAAERTDGTSFTVDDVADGIVAKLVRRHPHVFGDVTVSGADEVTRNWDEIKREEKRARAERHGRGTNGQAAPSAPSAPAAPAAPSALDGVPFGQPALALAAQLQRRAARAGAPDELARLEPSESGEPGEPGEPGAPGRPGAPGAPGADIGRELFLLVAKAREMDLDPETELRAAARRYQDRVRAWERS